MKNLLKISLFVSCFIMLQSCGGVFNSQSQNSASDNSAQNINTVVPTEGAEDTEEPEAEPKEESVLDKKAAKISTDDGSLSWKTESAASSVLDVQFEMKIPYGRINKMSSTIIRALSPYACQYISGISNSSPNSYKDGEIPCGGIVDQSWKQIIVVPVNTIAGESSGINYQINGFQIPVWIARAQRSGIYTEKSLDSKKNEQLTSSKKFAEDISIRYQPTGTSAKYELCLNLPGTTIRSTRNTISAKAWKKVLGVKISYGSDFEIDPGGASFDYARGCFAVNFGWTSNKLAPKISFEVTKKPFIQNATYSGLQIKIKDWFLNLINKIVGFFTTSITDRVEKIGINKANNILDSDVETGRWFTKVHGEELVNNTGKKLTEEISRALTRVGVPATSQDLRNMIKDNCRLLKFSKNEEWTAELKTFCEDIAQNIKLQIEPFAVDEQSAEKGCYDSFGRVHNSQSKWWAKDCMYSAKFSIQLPIEYDKYQKYLKKVISTKFSLSRIPSEWRSYLEKYDIDELNLFELLEELELQGYTQITVDDWENRLGVQSKKVRAKQAYRKFSEIEKSYE